MLPVERTTADGVRRFLQQGAQAVLRLTDTLADGQQRGFERGATGTCLTHCHIIFPACFHEGFQRGDGFVPVHQRLSGNGKLFVEHQQRVVAFGYGRYQLCPHRLFISTALFEHSRRTAFGIRHLAEDVHLPCGCDTKVVSLLRLPVVTAATCLWRQVQGGQVGKTGVRQRSLRLLHLQAGDAKVGITFQSRGYERL